MGSEMCIRDSIESVPFIKTDEGPVPQLSDQFIDGSLMALHQIDPSAEDHFRRLKNFFDRLYDDN